MGSRAHWPGSRPVPTSTYRLQLTPDWGFERARDAVGYLARLGISHLYLSPILQAAPGSTHGYDVVDHSRISSELGGADAFAALAERAHDAGLGLVVDVVPNHMAVPAQTWRNPALYRLLRDGASSPFARWFDVDFSIHDGRILMPVLGEDPAAAIEAGTLRVSSDGGPGGDEGVLRYFDREFPLAPGTQGLGTADALAAQHYRLASWREGDRHLNYRRFFDVTSLIAVRVEDPDVFAATHALLASLVEQGVIDGLRIDHPDGLADPAGYLAHLAEATGDAWVVVEKILEGSEELRPDWRCAGTTGYDALKRINQALTPPGADPTLDALWAEHTDTARAFGPVELAGKRAIIDTSLVTELARLHRLLARMTPAIDQDALRRALAELLIAMPRYRAYVVPGEPVDPAERAVIEKAAQVAGTRLDPADHPALEALVPLALGAGEPADEAAAREFVVRFQQTCGPVMAKGVEDTAFYRYLRYVAANEVGGDPTRLHLSAADFHAYSERMASQWPGAMVTLNTHDTKRSADVRAALVSVATDPHGWQAWVREASRLGARHRPDLVDAATEYLVWQTLVGAWPLNAERLGAYLIKAVREAKTHTRWVDPDAEYEAAVCGFASDVLGDAVVATHVRAWLADHAAIVRTATLGAVVLHLAMPGVPDVYQGSETLSLRLVDPDNRAPLDDAALSGALARLDRGDAPADLGEEKLALTAALLRLRRDHREWFGHPDASYAPLDVPGAIGFARGDGEQRIACVSRLPGAPADPSASLPVVSGTWRDALTGATHLAGDGLALDDVCADSPVAVLVRQA